MAEQTITIGGRDYEVACEDGEESFLHRAAALLDAEAETLRDQIGRQPEARTLLMAGLMLADRTTGLQDRLQDAERRVAELSRKLEASETRRSDAPELPPELLAAFRQLAEESEALAGKVEARSAAD